MGLRNLINVDQFCDKYDHSGKDSNAGILALIPYGNRINSDGSVGRRSQVDMIKVVRNAVAYHTQNMKKNDGDYSRQALKNGPEWVAGQQRANTGLWYHSNVGFPGVESDTEEVLKMGITELNGLVVNLRNPLGSYAGGRLVKPVKPEHLVDDAAVATQLAAGLEADRRIHAASSLIRLGIQGEIPEDVFMVNVAETSYLGSLRNRVGFEKAGKAASLVRQNHAAFKAVLQAPTVSIPNVTWENGTIVNNADIEELLAQLPADLQTGIDPERAAEQLTKYIRSRNFWESMSMFLKGWRSVGTVRGALYIGRKGVKGVTSRASKWLQFTNSKNDDSSNNGRSSS